MTTATVNGHDSTIIGRIPRRMHAEASTTDVGLADFAGEEPRP